MVKAIMKRTKKEKTSFEDAFAAFQNARNSLGFSAEMEIVNTCSIRYVLLQVYYSVTTETHRFCLVHHSCRGLPSGMA